MHLVMDSDNEDIRLETFYQLWGCKESYTKALGLGLSLDLLKLDFSNVQDTVSHQQRYSISPPIIIAILQ